MSNSRQPWNVIKGISATYTVQAVDGDGNPYTGHFTGAESLTAYAWPGDDQAQSFALTPSWNSATLGLIDVQVSAASTTAQNAGVYQWLLKLTDSSAAIARGELNLLGAVGTGLPGLPDLVALSYVQSALASVSLTQDQVDYLPYAVNSASLLVRRFCNRRFTRATFTETSSPSLEGLVRLNQIPVNRVIRVSNKLLSVMNIWANETMFQNAYVNFSTTGDFADSNTALTYTGINLVSSTNGVTTTTPLLFATYTTLGALATAINAVSGWTATVNAGNYGSWAVTELFCDDGSQGALDEGVSLRVFTQDVSKMRVDSRTGMISLGYGAATSGFGPKWGPTWFAMDDPTGYGFDDNFVRVIYDAGYDVVPPPIQQATAELTKDILERFRTDFALKGESIGAYKYELRDRYDGIPQHVRQTLSRWVITNA